MFRLAAEPFIHKLGWIGVTAPLSACSAEVERGEQLGVHGGHQAKNVESIKHAQT